MSLEVDPRPGSSVFARLSLDRALVHWEDWLWQDTPVELGRSGAYYKREDAFAPLGYGGINGSKLRQLIWLVDQAVRSGARGVLTGASVLSPQVGMTAAVAAHYALPCVIVLGGTGPRTAGRHESVAIARRFGAQFRFAPVGFNPTLQRHVAELAESPEFAGWYRLPYAISLPPEADDRQIEAFHRLGAHQAATIPQDVHTVHMTAGSCNSCVSVMYGVARSGLSYVQRLVLYEVGPSRRDWMYSRLAAIERATGLRMGQWFARGGRVQVDTLDLHASGLVSYAQRRPAVLDGIRLHPTYEGKVMYARQGQPFEPSELLWIVGSEPSLAAMERYLEKAQAGRQGSPRSAEPALQSAASEAQV